MFDPLQSAYRNKHSTEPTLFKVQNDILLALDADLSAILLMLNLSAAFNTMNHDIMLSQTCNVCGITCNTLHWFKSYLTGMMQLFENMYPYIRSLVLELHRVHFWVRRFLARTANMLVTGIFSPFLCRRYTVLYDNGSF